ncbi:hypothetical protein HMPREF9138_00970 [Prevotella histicola F0411]|uniref:Uncharacterized protein n=2 Tax=Prevotella histicola TaxID=470565 RepID=G6AFU3_9BACT|nr:hypothetical protein HMPREF9138_00970 [Prevotella histicola F0411]
MHCEMEKSDGSDRKIEKQVFLWCSYNNAEGEILACFEREKGIRKVVIKIHTLKITGGL